MRSGPLRISLVPLMLLTFLLMSSLGPAPVTCGSGPGNGGGSEPPEQRSSNLVVGIAAVVVAVGLIWWFTRGDKEPEEEKSDAVIEPAPESSSEVPAKEEVPAKLTP